MSDEEAIQALQQRWFAATTSGDVAEISVLMTEDVEFLVPGRKPFGRQEFLEQFRSMKDSVTLNCSGRYEEIVVTGDMAFAKAWLEIIVTPGSGGQIRHLSGYTLSIFRRSVGGQWRLFRDANLLVPKSTSPS